MSSNGIFRRQVGRFTVTALFDGMISIPRDAVAGIGSVELNALMPLTDNGGLIPLPVSAFAVSTESDTFLVDTGGADAIDPGLGFIGERLLAAGIAAADITAVLLTHLHTDHFGGLIGPGGTAAFPKAEVFLHQHAKGVLEDIDLETLPPPTRSYIERMRGILAPYRDRLRYVSNEIVRPGIQGVPLPGHTASHMGWLLSSQGESLLIWGDIIHLPMVQFAHPDVYLSYDVNAEQAIASRRSILDYAARERLLVAGMHHAFPCFGHIEQSDDQYHFIPEPNGA